MKPKILVIDDDANIQIILKFMLDKDFEIIQSFNTGEAFLFLKNEKIDLVITDLNMPGESGLEFVQRIKSEDSLSSIPILVLTGLPSSEKQKKAELFGVADFILKPINRQLLLNRVHSLILNSQAQAEAPNQTSVDATTDHAGRLTELAQGKNRIETLSAWYHYLQSQNFADGIALISQNDNEFKLIAAAGTLQPNEAQLLKLSGHDEKSVFSLPGIEGLLIIPVSLKSGRDLLIKSPGSQLPSSAKTFLLLLKNQPFTALEQHNLSTIFSQVAPAFKTGVS